MIDDLGSGDFTVRQSAFKELEKLEEKAAGILNDTLKKNLTLEVRRRVESLLKDISQLQSGESIGRLRAIQILEDIGTEDARQILDSLAQGGVYQTRETADARASADRLRMRRMAAPPKR